MVVLSVEVHAAFDEVRAVSAAQALQGQGSPLPHAAGVVQDVLGNWGRPTLGITREPTFPSTVVRPKATHAHRRCGMSS